LKIAKLTVSQLGTVRKIYALGRNLNGGANYRVLTPKGRNLLDSVK